tara:strand:- start:658 stop:879 length:222 start_codon:yes stop_codon:yes gene_type:complete
MKKLLIIKIILVITSLFLHNACSTEAMSFSSGFLEGYSEKMREERYINNMIQLEKEKQKVYLCIYQQRKEFCK